jgi:hypothetical protein
LALLTTYLPLRLWLLFAGWEHGLDCELTSLLRPKAVVLHGGCIRGERYASIGLFYSFYHNLMGLIAYIATGINCRFGMKGVAAAAHFDGRRNFVAMLRGRKRYVVSAS